MHKLQLFITKTVDYKKRRRGEAGDLIIKSAENILSKQYNSFLLFENTAPYYDNSISESPTQLRLRKTGIKLSVFLLFFQAYSVRRSEKGYPAGLSCWRSWVRAPSLTKKQSS